MKIIKRTQGHDVILEYVKVKEYPTYTIYDVYKGDKFLYKTCLTSIQLAKIVLAGYVLNEEEACR